MAAQLAAAGLTPKFADLVNMNKAELMAEYGTKSRRLSKEQLIHKIMEVRHLCLEEGQ